MIDLNIKSDNITIDNNTIGMQDFSDGETSFKIDVQRLTDKEYSDFMVKFSKKINTIDDKMEDSEKLMKTQEYWTELAIPLFKSHVRKWEGIGSNGKKFACNAHNKGLLIDYKLDFVIAVMSSVFEQINSDLEAKKK